MATTARDESKTADSEQRLLKRQLRRKRLQYWLRQITIGYVITLALWLGLLEWFEGKSWLLSIALFVPPQCWLFPLIILTPVCIFLYRKLCWLHFGAVALVFFGFMNWNLQFKQAKPSADLTLLSNNIAQRNLNDLWTFVQQENPDVIALQDVGIFGGQARRRFPTRFVSVRQQFILVSRFPILTANPVPGMTFNSKPVAIRYELAFGKKQIVIYNIHMPTPRQFFNNLRGDGFRRSLFLGTGIYSKEAWEEYADYWGRRIELTRTLLTWLKQEQEPFLLAGDFNMPDHGTLYHEFNSRFEDVFRSAGEGYGLSFPGNMEFMITLDRPWMRIDYQFADRDHWRPVWCRIEPYKQAKHLALVGRYDLQ